MNSKLLLSVACSVLCLPLAWLPNQAQAEEHKNIEYAKVGDTALHLDLYLPEKPNKAEQLVVWIHGGAWRNGSKDRCAFTWLNQYGYAVASIQYRLTDAAIFPAQIHDCKAAIRFLRANAEKYGYAAEKVGVIGISAGGHLVALLGTGGDVPELEGTVGGNLEHSSRVQAVVDMCGPSDFLLFFEQQPGAFSRPNSPVALLLGGPVPEKQELAKLASPTAHITADDPPLLIIHGTKDSTVNPQQSKHLRDLYEQAKLNVKLELIPEGGHVPQEFFDRDRRELIRNFYNEHLRGEK